MKTQQSKCYQIAMICFDSKLNLTPPFINMDFFETIHEFYKNQKFTDIEIFTFDSFSFKLLKVCECHRLVICALFPQTKNLLNDDKVTIILQDFDPETLKSAFDAVYSCLENGVDPCNELLYEVFGMTAHDSLQRRLNESRKIITYDNNLFEYESIEDVYDATNKYLSVQIDNVRYIPKGSSKFFCCFAITQKNGQNLAGMVSSTTDKESLSNDKYCLRLLDILTKLFAISLTDIYQLFNDVNHYQAKIQHIIFDDQSLLEQKTYMESVSKPKNSCWVPLPVDETPPRLSFKVVDLNQIDDNVKDLVIIHGDEINSLRLCPCFNKEDIATLDNHGKAQVVVESMLSLLGLTSINDLLNISVFKAMIDIHFERLAKAEAMANLGRPINPIKIPRKRTAASLPSMMPAKTKSKVELKCPHEGCEKVFKKKGGWSKHVNYYHLKEGSGVACDECGVVYQNFFYLGLHKRQAHEEVTCKECHQSFIGDNELGRHRRKIHLTGTEHICEVCGQGFKMRFYMQRHKRQRHPECVSSPYFCKECNRYFGTNRKLRDHMTGTHLKTRPYQCRAGEGICQKAFFNVNLRRKHERQVHHLHIFTPSGTKSNKIVKVSE